MDKLNLSKNPASAWARPNVVSYYLAHRRTVGELYPSEARLLPELLRPGISVLDVGCATGGFCAILKELQPNILYTGVDISETMIAEARGLFPDSRFEVARADSLPFPDGSFDLVLSAGGTFPMILEWRQALRECWRVTRNRVAFDVRVIESGGGIEDITRSYVKLDFDGRWDGKAMAPYVVVTMDALVCAVLSLTPAPVKIRGYGYYHEVSGKAVTPFREVCMTAVWLGKQNDAGARVLWEVPLPWSEPKRRP